MVVQETEAIPGVNMADLRLRGFRVHEITATTELPPRSGRRDFFKMGLVDGEMTINFGGQVHEIKGPALVFVNPKVPRNLVQRVNRTGGYACIFTENFVNTRELHDSPLFRAGDRPVIKLDDRQAAFLTAIFQQMLSVYNSDYLHKADVIRSCIALVIHEALQIQPPVSMVRFKNGAARISHLFLDLLERQFPIEHLGDMLKLRTAQDFAAALAVHVNYLNRSIKEVTGKTTSAHIAARIIAEAKSLLQHTEWSVAEISYALGFEYPAYFNNYFKRLTGTTPTCFRKV